MFLRCLQSKFFIFLQMLPCITGEPPSQFYSQPFLPTVAPPSTSYGIPDSYGPPGPQQPPPRQEYGPPAENLEPVVHKHVYFHIPPPEPEYPNEVPIRTAPPKPVQKHYRIIFIKAPTQPPPVMPTLPPLQPGSEEKTIVYVLVKKPDELPEIIMPTPVTTVPTKPEVYFIRYKTEEQKTQPPEEEPTGYYRRRKRNAGVSRFQWF